MALLLGKHLYVKYVARRKAVRSSAGFKVTDEQAIAAVKAAYKKAQVDR